MPVSMVRQRGLKVALEMQILAAAYDPYPYVEDEVVYENKAGAAKLAGTLTQPPGEGPVPAGLLITGPSQPDRDEALLWHRPFATTEDCACGWLAAVALLKI